MKGKGLLRKFSTLVLFFFMLSVVGVVAPTSTLAGDGGGDQIPTLLATYLTQVSGDTSTDVHQVTETKKVVPIKPTFRLNFSNNVTDETIWADNQGCVSIEDSNSSALPVDVTRIGTGLGTDPYKSDIFVTPTNDLISGYTYTIVIDAALTAKNGQVLTQAVEVPFTAGVAVTGVSLDQKALNLEMGESGSLIATVTPQDAAVTDVSWSSDAEGIATVDDGTVTPVSVGSATITVTTNDGQFTDTCLVNVVAATVLVDSITVTPETLELPVGGSATKLTVTVLPENASNTSVTWSSDTPSVATVDQEGNVTPVAEGDANITATANDGSGESDFCLVTVASNIVLVDSITISPETLDLTVGGSGSQLTAAVLPENASNTSVTWSSDTPGVATVDQNGFVTPVAEGDAIITATAVDGSDASDSCAVSVSPANIPVTAVTLEDESLVLEFGGQSESLCATITPEDATNQELTWSSDNETIATVTQDGLVAPVAVGNATITVASQENSDIKDTCLVSVEIIPTNIELNTNELTLMAELDTAQLTATITPDTVTNKTVTWSSDKPEVASVDQNGLVTALSAGVATITATTANEEMSDCCDVTVEPKGIPALTSFEVGGESCLDLPGVVVDIGDKYQNAEYITQEMQKAETGATMQVEDFNGFAGVYTEANSQSSTIAIKLYTIGQDGWVEQTVTDWDTVAIVENSVVIVSVIKPGLGGTFYKVALVGTTPYLDEFTAGGEDCLGLDGCQLTVGDKYNDSEYVLDMMMKPNTGAVLPVADFTNFIGVTALSSNDSYQPVIKLYRNVNRVLVEQNVADWATVTLQNNDVITVAVINPLVGGSFYKVKVVSIVDEGPNLYADFGDYDGEAYPPSEAKAGEKISFSFMVTNDACYPTGELDKARWNAGASVASIYLYTEDEDGNRTVVYSTEKAVSAIAAVSEDADEARYKVVKVKLTLPGNLSPGTYMIGVKLDINNTVIETDEEDNTTEGECIEISSPELSVGIASITPSTCLAGKTTKLNLNLINSSQVTAGKFTVKIFLSSDEVFSANDTLLYTKKMSKLVSTPGQLLKLSVKVPKTQLPGDYTLFAVIDADNTVGESDETNNTASAALKVTSGKK